MAIILKTNNVNLFVSSVLFVFWYHSPNFLNTPCSLRGLVDGEAGVVSAASNINSVITARINMWAAILTFEGTATSVYV
jgi:hypothetical protein